MIESLYFDFNDLENPVKYHLMKHNYFYPLYDQTQQCHFYVRENNYILNDDLIRYYETPAKTFYSIEDTRYFLEPQRGSAVMTFNFLKDYIVDEYERDVLSILDVTGTIGGVFEIIAMASGFVVGFITNTLFHQNLTSGQPEEEEASLYSYPLTSSQAKYRRAQTVPLKKSRTESNRLNESSKEWNLSSIHLEAPNSDNSQNPSLDSDEVKMKEFKKRLSNLRKLICGDKLRFSKKDLSAGLDCMNILVTLRELRLYVEYLIQKDVLNEMQNDLDQEQSIYSQDNKSNLDNSKSQNRSKLYEYKESSFKRFYTHKETRDQGFHGSEEEKS